MTRRAALPVSAVAMLLVVAAWVGLPVPAAQAAPACSGATGVTVVVDFNELDGGVQGACVADGGGDLATSLFEAAGFAVNANTPRNPGYVCQVGAKPSGCTPPDANRYWGLWWTDGTKSTWTYSSLGAGSLRVPDGGYVAFAWDQVAGNELPSYTPTPRTAPSPTPAPQPTSQPTRTPSPSAQPTRTPSAAPTASASSGATATPGQQPTGQPSAQPTSAVPSTTGTPSSTPTSATPSAAPSTPSTPAPTPTDPASPTPGATPTDPVTELADPVAPTAADTDGDGGLPGWVAPLVIVLLFGAVGGVLVLQRRTRTP